MYPMRQPDLRRVKFATLVSLSEAAEKYQVFAAMEICTLHMEAAIPVHPFEVLSYGAKHGYASLTDMAEVQATSMSIEDAYAGLTLKMYIAWTRYHGRWLSILDHAHQWRPNANHEPCDLWKRLFAETSSRLGSNPKSLRKLDDIFRAQDVKPATTNPGIQFGFPGRTTCTHCYNNIVQWRRSVETEMHALPRLGIFL
jgi:hypothetical protein